MSYNIQTNSINTTIPINVSSGGTGVNTIPSNGQILIGNGTNYSLSTIIPGSGIFGGIAGSFIDPVDGLIYTTSQTTIPASANGVKFFTMNRARNIPAYVSDIGPACALQSFLGSHRIAYVTAIGNNTTALQVVGCSITATGTATTRTVATTNELTQLRRLGYLGSASVNNVVGIFSPSLQYYRGDSATKGGFHGVFKWNLSGSLGATSMSLIGFTASASVFAPSNNEPFKHQNILAFGAWSGGNLHFVYNDSVGNASTIDLGSGFLQNASDAYEGHIYCIPGGAFVYYYIKNLVSGVVASGQVNTDLPSSTQLLTFHCETSCGTSAVASAIDISSVYIETPY